MTLERDLRATSNAFLHELGRLHDLEVKKRQIEPGTEEFSAIAREVETLANELMNVSAQQTELALKAEVHGPDGDGTLDLSPIESVAPIRQVHEVLADWRDAERRLQDAEQASPDFISIRAEVVRLREEYRRAVEAATSREARRP
jgi:hypothetical protein